MTTTEKTDYQFVVYDVDQVLAVQHEIDIPQDTDGAGHIVF
jgi:hypothetical protein